MVATSTTDKQGKAQKHNITGKIINHICVANGKTHGITPIQAGQALCQTSCKDVHSGCCVVDQKTCKIRRLALTNWSIGVNKKTHCHFSHTKPLKIANYTYPTNPKIPKNTLAAKPYWQIKKRPVITQAAPARWIHCKPNCKGKWSNEKQDQTRPIELDGKKGNEFIIHHQPYRWTSINERGIPVEDLVIVRQIKGQFQEIFSASFVAIIEQGKQKKNPDLYVYYQKSAVDIEHLYCNRYTWKKQRYALKASCVARKIHKLELKRIYQNSNVTWHHKSFAFPWSSYKSNTPN